jgi:DNA modification methylase
MCFTDPPYNVNYANSADDKRRGKSRAILNDALGETFGAFLYDASVNILTVTKGSIYICMSSSELDTLQKAFREAGGRWSTFVIWAKKHLHPRTLGLSTAVRADPLRMEGRAPTILVWRARSGRCLVRRQAP